MKVFLRVLVAFALLAWLLSRMDIPAVMRLVAQASPVDLLFAFLSVHVAYVLLTFRWKILLDGSSIRVPFRDILKLTYISHFAGYLLPGGFSIDAVRGVYLWRDLPGKRGEGLASILVDRVVGFWAILFLAFLGAVGLKERALVYPLGLALLAMTAGWIVAFLEPVGKILRRVAEPIRGGHYVLRLYEATRRFARAPGRLLLSAGISLAFQFFYVLAAHLTLRAVTSSPPSLPATLAYVSLINALTMIPVTVGGLGIREGGFVAAFSRSMSREAAFASSLLYYAVSVLAALPGAFLWLLERDRIRAVLHEES